MRPLLPLLVLLTTCLSFAEQPFTDVADSSFRSSISYLQSRGLISGFPDGTFRPRQAMTRAEFLAMVLRAVPQADVPVGGQCLAAMPAGVWYAPVMCQGVSLGLIGADLTQLRPGDTIVYAEALKIVLGAWQFSVPDDNGGQWYEPYIQFAAEHGILSSLAYRPTDFVTREVAASILYRSMVLAGQDTPPLPAAEPDAEPAGADPAPHPVARACPATVTAPPATLTVNGLERQLITYVPAGLQPGKPVPLIVAFHGRTNSNEQVRRYMRLEGHGVEAIIVYPAGLPAGGNARNWNDPSDGGADLRDYALFDSIVTRFSREYCIDSERVFVVGHSLGAYFANSVACARAGVVRAVASIAGGIQTSGCAEPVAALLFHNPADTLVVIHEGERARDTFLSSNGLTGLEPRQLGDVFNCSVYHPGSGDHSVTWCPHRIDRPYGDSFDPHSWPAAIGPYVMEFFSRF